jgi:hypothetical protein
MQNTGPTCTTQANPLTFAFEHFCGRLLMWRRSARRRPLGAGAGHWDRLGRRALGALVAAGQVGSGRIIVS